MVYDIQSLLMQWETAGIFDYVLPFLLIFAIIFGILSATKISGSNKGVHLIIALSILVIISKSDRPKMMKTILIISMINQLSSTKSIFHIFLQTRSLLNQNHLQIFRTKQD